MPLIPGYRQIFNPDRIYAIPEQRIHHLWSPYLKLRGPYIIFRDKCESILPAQLNPVAGHVTVRSHVGGPLPQCLEILCYAKSPDLVWWLPYTYSKHIGISMWIGLNYEAATYMDWLHVGFAREATTTDPVPRAVGAIRVRTDNDTLEYMDSTGTPTKFADYPIPNTAYSIQPRGVVWSYLKFVLDFGKLEYVWCRFNEELYDLKGKGLHQLATVENERQIHLEVIPRLGGNRLVYLSDIVITGDEPL